MNKWEYEISFDKEKTHFGNFGMYVKINDSKDILNVGEFLKIETSGRYALFICTCGDFGCGGYYLDVEIRQNSWLFGNKYEPFDGDFWEALNIEIELSEIKRLKNDLLNAIAKFKAENPDCKLSCGFSGPRL